MPYCRFFFHQQPGSGFNGGGSSAPKSWNYSSPWNTDTLFWCECRLGSKWLVSSVYIYIFLEMIGCTCENCCCRTKQKSCRARALRDGISFYSSLGHSFACIEILLRDDDMRGKYNTTSSGLDIGLLQSSGIQMGKN